MRMSKKQRTMAAALNKEEEPSNEEVPVVSDLSRHGGTRIDVLADHGINAGDIKKLRDAGMCTVEAVQQAPKKVLLEVKGMTDARYDSIIAASGKVTEAHAGKFKTATQLRDEHMSTRFRVATGSKELDTALGGGIESKLLTEVYGEYRTGKTQLCATMAVTAQLDPRFGGKVIYVDTEGNFFPERLRPICERFGVEFDTIMSNIVTARIFCTDQQEQVPLMIEKQIDEDEGAPYSLVIIDSLMALWRVDFSGRGELSERQQKLGKHLNELRKLAERHNLAVVYTNQVQSDPGGGMMAFAGEVRKPLGGHVVGHASNTRIMFRKGRDTERIAKIVDSPTMPEVDATFMISATGVGDA